MKHKLTTSFLIVAMVLATAMPVAAGSSALTYTAQKGDTFANLSWKYGVSLDRLLAANGIARNGDPMDSKRFWLTPGQVVTVPYEPGYTPSLVNAFYHNVQPGETLGTLSAQFEIAAWAAAVANGLTTYMTVDAASGMVTAVDFTKALPAGKTLLIPAGPHVHDLQKNETVADVAALYGVSKAYLLKANGLSEPVAAGTDIKIPTQYDRPFTPIGGAPAASVQPTAAPVALTASASSGPLTMRWVAQKTGWASNEVGPTATFFVEFKGGKAPYRVWTPQWGTIKTGDPYTYSDGGETWTRIEFSVTAKCGETVRIEPNITDASGANVWALRDFTAECK